MRMVHLLVYPARASWLEACRLDELGVGQEVTYHSTKGFTEIQNWGQVNTL